MVLSTSRTFSLQRLVVNARALTRAHDVDTLSHTVRLMQSSMVFGLNTLSSSRMGGVRLLVHRHFDHATLKRLCFTAQRLGDKEPSRKDPGLVVGSWR